MAYRRCMMLAAVGLTSVGAHACQGEACPINGAELLQTRREQTLTERQKWMLIREQGQRVNVRCDPDCRGHEQFTLTLVAPTLGEKVFHMTRNNNIFSKHFHIQVDMPDGSIKRKKMPKHEMECHYMGQDLALTTCEGLSGHFFAHGTYVRLWQKDDGDLILGGKEEIPARFRIGTNESVALLDEYEDLDEEGTCGDGIIGDGEDCDGGLCCTSSCTFASAGEQCAPQSDACSTGGTCTGASAMCSLNIVRNGVECENDGVCFEGFCTSRESQCNRAGFPEGSCNKTSCSLLHCIDEGKCIPIFDTPVEGGTPCSDSSQVCTKYGCTDPSAYKTDKIVVSDSLTDMGSAHVANEEPAAEEPEAAQMMNFGTAVQTMVVTGAAARGGWSAAKCGEYMNYVNAGIYYSTPGMQGFAFQLHRYIVYNGGEFNGLKVQTDDVFRMAEIAHGKVTSGVWPRGAMATAMLQSHEGCSGGRMWGHKLCTNYGYGFMGISHGDGRPCDYGFNTNRWGFDVVAHEMGHSLGMSDLVGHLAGHNNAGPTWMGMKQPNSGKKYNTFSVHEFKQYFPTSKNLCRGGGQNPGNTGGNPGNGGSCVDTERNHCALYKANGWCHTPNVASTCRRTCGSCGSQAGGSCVDTERNHCVLYKNNGWCNTENVRNTCKRTCGFCGGALKRNSTTSSR